MITFIHTADIHFGVENYGKIDPETGIHSRLWDFYRSLNTCIDAAIAKKVDFFLFAGDAYKTAHPTPTQQQLLLKSLLRLHEAGIPTVLVIGNHDNPLSFGKSHSLDLYSALPVTGFHVIDTPKMVHLSTHNGPVQIVGIPWPTRNTISLAGKHENKSASDITSYISEAVVAIIDHLAEQLDPHLPAVLAGHLTVSSGIFSGSEKRAVYGTDPLFLPSQLARPPFDYVALGHLHRHQNLNNEGYPPVVYAGSIDRIDFGERKEEKGFCMVTLSKKGETHYEFIPLVTRPFIQIEVTLQEEVDDTTLILNAIAAQPIEGAIVKIVYHLSSDRKDSIDIKTIQSACASAMHLVGIFPVRTISAPKSRRIPALSHSTDLVAALDTYFSAKPEYAVKKKELIAQILQLEQEVNQANEES
jgi:exonuclease SbcD